MQSPDVNFTQTNNNSPEKGSPHLTVLREEGLVFSKKCLPVYSLTDLFIRLKNTEEKNVQKITKELTAFLVFIRFSQNLSIPSILREAVRSKYESLEETLLDRNTIFNSTLLQLFCYLYKISVCVFSLTKKGLTSQIYGLKRKRSFNVIFNEGSFSFLKKRLRSINSTKTSNNFNRNTNQVRSERLFESPVQNFKKNKTTLLDLLPKEREVDSITDSPLSTKETKTKGIKNIRTLSTLESFNPDRRNSEGSETNLQQSEGRLSNSLLNQNIGKLKFYSELKEYGFILLKDGSEIFVHKTDLLKNNIDTNWLVHYSRSYEIGMGFDVQHYKGREKMNRKAVNIKIFNIQPIINN